MQSIGEESNSLEEVEAAVEHDAAANVYTEYRDPRRTDWIRKTLPAVKAARLATLVDACRGKISRRALIDIRAARSSPPESTPAGGNRSTALFLCLKGSSVNITPSHRRNRLRDASPPNSVTDWACRDRQSVQSGTRAEHAGVIH